MTADQIAQTIQLILSFDNTMTIEILPKDLMVNYNVCFFHEIETNNANGLSKGSILRSINTILPNQAVNGGFDNPDCIAIVK